MLRVEVLVVANRAERPVVGFVPILCVEEVLVRASVHRSRRKCRDAGGRPRERWSTLGEEIRLCLAGRAQVAVKFERVCFCPAGSDSRVVVANEQNCRPRGRLRLSSRGTRLCRGHVSSASGRRSKVEDQAAFVVDDCSRGCEQIASEPLVVVEPPVGRRREDQVLGTRRSKLSEMIDCRVAVGWVETAYPPPGLCGKCAAS